MQTRTISVNTLPESARRILDTLREAGGMLRTTAEELAERLCLSRRTVQLALRQLWRLRFVWTRGCPGHYTWIGILARRVPATPKSSPIQAHARPSQLVETPMQVAHRTPEQDTGRPIINVIVKQPGAPPGGLVASSVVGGVADSGPMDEGAQLRIEDARRKAAGLPDVADPLVVELLGYGFTWDGPGPDVLTLWRTHGRDRIARNVAEVKRRRGLSPIGPGTIMGACREDWASLPSSASPPVALAVALAVAPASAPIHTGFCSSTKSTNTTTFGPAKAGGGGDKSSGGMKTGESWDLLAGLWAISLRSELAQHPRDVVQAGIDLARDIGRAKGMTGETLEAAKWRWIAFVIRSGKAAEHAETRRVAARRAEEHRARQARTLDNERCVRQAAESESARWQEFIVTLDESTLRAAAAKGLGQLTSLENRWLDGALRTKSADSLAQLRTRIVRRPDVFAAIIDAMVSGGKAVAHAS